MSQEFLTALLTVFALTGVPVGIMFRALVKSYENQIADLQNRLDRALTVGETAAHSNETLTEVVKARRR